MNVRLLKKFRKGFTIIEGSALYRDPEGWYISAKKFWLDKFSLILSYKLLYRKQVKTSKGIDFVKANFFQRLFK